MAGGVLTFFGLMHGEAVGVAQNLGVVVAYLAVGAVLFGSGRFSKPAPVTVEKEPEHEPELEAVA